MANTELTDQPQRWHFTKSPLFWVVAIIVAIGLIDLINAGISMLRPVRRGPDVHKGIGERLLFLAIEPLTGDGAPLAQSDLQGHVTLLNFWGPWCPPCRAELPHLAELRRRFAGNPSFRLAAISYPPGGVDDGRYALKSETKALLKQLDLDVPTYYDSDSQTLKAVDQVIGFEGFPTNLLLDRHGVIRAIWVGYRSGVETEIERSIDEALSEAEKPRQR